MRRVICESKSGREVFEAEVFIDATGDGDVCDRAGAGSMKGEDGRMQGMALRFRIGMVDIPAYLDWGMNHLEHFRGRSREQLLKIKARAEKGDSFYLGTDMSEIVTRLQAYSVWQYCRKHIPGFEDSAIVETAPQVGVRESRAIVGDYVLTTDDSMALREFDDSVLTGRVSFDSHDKSKYDRTQIKGGLVDVPYRCFLPKGIDGLLIAGRCLSTDHLTNSAIRRMESAFQAGEVAGTAAALALDKG